MPHIFISTIALCANLYRCAPLIVGDRYSDPKIMRYLGAKVTTDYPEPNSPPIYVMYATLRSVVDALEEMGWELKHVQAVQGYYTCVMHKEKGSQSDDDDEYPEDPGEIITSSKSIRTLKDKNRSNKNEDKSTSTRDLVGTSQNVLQPSTGSGLFQQQQSSHTTLKTDGSTRSLRRGGATASSTESRKDDNATTFRPEDSVIPVQAATSEASSDMDDNDRPKRSKSEHTRKGLACPMGRHKKKSSSADSDVAKKSSNDHPKKSKGSSDSDTSGSPYSPKKVNKAHKRPSTQSTVKEIFRD